LCSNLTGGGKFKTLNEDDDQWRHVPEKAGHPTGGYEGPASAGLVRSFQRNNNVLLDEAEQSARKYHKEKKIVPMETSAATQTLAGNIFVQGLIHDGKTPGKSLGDTHRHAPSGLLLRFG
jgi:hypothetical protein